MRGYTVIVNGKSYNVDIVERDGAPVVSYAAPVAAAPVAKAAAPVAAAPVAAPVAAAPVVATAGERVEAPMPGTVLQVLVKEGDTVQAGDTLCTLEAMKMENEIVAPVAGTVKQVAATKGSAVVTGDLLVVLG